VPAIRRPLRGGGGGHRRPRPRRHRTAAALAAGSGRPGCARRALRTRRRCPPGRSTGTRGRGLGDLERGSSSWQRSRAYAQRGANRQPGGGLRSGRADAPMVAAGCGWGRSSFGIDCSSASVYGIFMLAKSVLGGRLLDDRPPYITAISSVWPATTPRSWVTRIIDMLRSRCSPMQVEDLRLHGHVERRGGLVGEEHRGAARERDGDHHALAHAARQLVRVLLEAPLGLGDAHVLQQRSARVGGFASAGMSRWIAAAR
jgi:hypothetical protein